MGPRARAASRADTPTRSPGRTRVAQTRDFAWLEALDRRAPLLRRRPDRDAKAVELHRGFDVRPHREKLVAGDHGARQRGQDHRALVVAEAAGHEPPPAPSGGRSRRGQPPPPPPPPGRRPRPPRERTRGPLSPPF